MANSLDERIAAIAVRCCDDGERMTFNELADELGQSRRFMGQRVGHAAQAMDDEGRSDEYDAINYAFTDEDGHPGSYWQD